MSTKKQPKKATPKPATGQTPKDKNNVGKVVDKSEPAPQKKPATRPDVKHTQEYLDSVKKEDIPSEMGRLAKELETAQLGKNYTRADQLKTAKAGLMDKAGKAGLRVKDFPPGSLSVNPTQAQAIGDAADFADPMGKRLAAKRHAEMAEMQKAKTKPGDKPTPTTTPTPATAQRGGWSEGKARNIKGKCGESLAKQDLINDGYTDVMEVQNASGHGVDLMGRNANGDVRVLEVKTTDGTTAPGLKGDQASMGGKGFTDSRLDRAANGKGHYKNSPEAIANGIKGQEWLKTAEKTGKKVDYKKHDVFIEDPEKGCIRKKKSESNPWEKKTPRSVGRRK